MKDLYALYSDLSSWPAEDLLVDSEWLPLALERDHLPGEEQDYAWARAERVPTLELKESHEVVVAHNSEKKVLYRVVRGPEADRLVLTRKAPLAERS